MIQWKIKHESCKRTFLFSCHLVQCFVVDCNNFEDWRLILYCKHFFKRIGIKKWSTLVRLFQIGTWANHGKKLPLKNSNKLAKYVEIYVLFVFQRVPSFHIYYFNFPSIEFICPRIFGSFPHWFLVFSQWFWLFWNVCVKQIEIVISSTSRTLIFHLESYYLKHAKNTKQLLARMSFWSFLALGQSVCLLEGLIVPNWLS